MLNVKNKLLPILCLALCLCIVWGSTTTAHAVEGAINVLNKAPEIGGEFYWNVTNEYTRNGLRQVQWSEMTCSINNTNLKTCLYLNSDKDDIIVFRSTDIPTVTVYNRFVDTGATTEQGGASAFMCKPYPYGVSVKWSEVTTTVFETNIPIFNSLNDAQSYVNGTLGIENAINYNKVLENGSWVRPFEDIEINDSDILVPQLSNITHEGFSCTNNNNDLYLVEVYVESGIQNITDYLGGGTSISNPEFANSFGMVSDNSEAQFKGDYISLNDCYGVDNISALHDNLLQLYTKYPSAVSHQKATGVEYTYDNMASGSPSIYDLWGRYFGKKYMFWRNNQDVDMSLVTSDLVDKIPLCYTNYRVRYFYYDDASGFHYGPWANVVYFSNGKVLSSSVFQSDSGNIIETPTTQGSIDFSTGNITYNDNANYIDLNNPNNLFGYIRSVTNNISATMGNFSTLFATVFTFIPADVQGMIWLGIAVMVIIGVIKVIKG